MPRHIEPLDGGLVNARDPSMLNPGELVLMNNLVYDPASPSPRQALGQLTVSDSAGGTINGIRHCAFDNGLSLIVAPAAGFYKSTQAGAPGAWTTLVTHESGSSLDTAYYDGKHYLFNGVGPNQVLRRDGTVRRHGLIAIASPPGVADGGAGIWPLTDDTLPAYYEWWATEVYKNEVLGEEVESTFTGTPATFRVENGAKSVLLTRPAIVNGLATHWRIYRSPAKKLSDIVFPVGFLIADVPITVASFKDGGAVATGLTLAGSGDNSVIDYTNVSGELIEVTGDWTTPDKVTADDAVNATSAMVRYETLGFEAFIYTKSPMRAGTFGLANIGTPVSDITVTVEGFRTGNAGLEISLSWDGGISWTAPQPVSLGVGPGVTIVSTGGTWGRVWNGLEFGNATFYVRLTAYATTLGTSTATITLDYVEVNVSHGGTTAAQNTFFPFTEVILGGTSYKNGAYGEPPAASFGDIFEDSMVTNDPENKTAIRYSIETLPESFPPEYFLPLATEKHDEVTAIKTLGSVLLVGLKTYVARVDFLPRAEDAEFSRGRAWDTVQGSHGIVGKKAAAVFFIPQKGLYLAHVSLHGVMMTNGYQADTLTDDLDFASMVDKAHLPACELVNFPEKYQLRMYYSSGGGTNNKALVFHYHPTHLKNGKPKVSGPLDIVTNGATLALLPDSNEVLFTANGDRLYRETTTDGPAYVLRTREIYPGGPGIGGEITKVLLRQNGGGERRVSPIVLAANVEPRVDTPIIVNAPSRGIVRVPMRVGCEGIQFQVERVSGNGGSLDYLVLEHVGFGPENYPA